MNLKPIKNLPTVLSLLLLISLNMSIASAQRIKWRGVYVSHEESWDIAGTPSSRWFRLAVKEENRKLQAIYSDGENSKTWKSFLLRVRTKKDSADFYFVKNLEGRSEFRKGDLVLTLNTKDGIIFQTLWGKINFGAYSELGGIRENGSFFKKVLKE